MLRQAIRDFMMLFATIDPIATLALFVPLTTAESDIARRRIAVRAVLWAGIVLLGFLIGGQYVLSALGIRLESFQISGGVILFLLGLQMVFGSGIAAHDATVTPGNDVAIFPLALPSIASPGAIMAVVLLTDNHRQDFAQQLLTGVVMAVILVLTLVLLLQATRIHRVLGETGGTVLIRVMGLILCALAAEQVITGIQQLQ